MAKTAPETILLKGRGFRKEKVAGGTITPGHLVASNSSDQLVVHATAAGHAQAMFAVEAEHLSALGGTGYNTSGGTIDDNYSSGDFVQSEILDAGCHVYALVAAAASAIVIGDALESAGDGTLRKRTPFSQNGSAPYDVTEAGWVVAYALEAVDNSGGGAPARIKVEVAC
jgi:hypothetical protein